MIGNITIKKDVKRILIAIAFGFLVNILNVDMTFGFLSAKLSTETQVLLSRFTCAFAMIDIIYIFFSIIKILGYKKAKRTRDNIKNNIESKIINCEKTTMSTTFSLNAAEIINKIIETYHVEDRIECSQELCENLKGLFYKNKDNQKTISYFILANNTYNTILNYIQDNNDFYKDCQLKHKEVMQNLNVLDFESNDKKYNSKEYNDILINLLHTSLENEPSDKECVDYLRAFYSWFCRNLYFNYKNLEEEQFMLLLQFIPVVVDKINAYSKTKNQKNIISHMSIELIVIRFLIMCFANKSVFIMCKTFKSKIITQSKVETYARYAGLVSRYYNNVFIGSKIILYITLLFRNYTFNNVYHEATSDYAVSLLLAAETIVANINSEEPIADKAANLIISIASFAV